ASKKRKSPEDHDEPPHEEPPAVNEAQEPLPDEDDAKFALHPDDPPNFLKLCTALRILTKRKLTDLEIETADGLIREYGTELITLYGSAVIKPNHHFAIHVGTCARNFGPLHDFWTFLFERLNKVLKSYKTNNHGNGELETTFFQEFHRTCEIGRLTFSLQRYPEQSLPFQTSRLMVKASNEERGTVAGLAALSQELDDVNDDAVRSYDLSPRHQTQVMSSDTYQMLARTICMRFPLTPVHCQYEQPLVPHSLPLNPGAVFFEYVIVNGKRYYASRTVGFNKSSFVHTIIPRSTGGVAHGYGEILEIFQVTQQFRAGGQSLWFARMRWFKAWEGQRDNVWKNL
ncbi:hypothetical protein PAXINDRAFT_158731, partial [Paxillus involutus ATCC 200175]